MLILNARWIVAFSRVKTQLKSAQARHRARRLILEQLETRDLLSAGSLRIADYNVGASDIGTPRAGLDTILQAIGTESVNGKSEPVDIVALQEVQSQATTSQAVVNLLNAIYGAGTYARGTLDGTSTGSGTQGVVYNTHTVQLLGENAIGTSSTSGQPRQALRYQFHVVDASASTDFYLYDSHYKASNDNVSAGRRLVEATAIRADADALGAGVNIVYAGDYNTYSSSETGYQKIISAGNGQAIDPLNMPGAWHGSTTFLPIATQAPALSPGGTLTGGGLDDRFDFQLITGALLDGAGMDYAAGSYHTFGNNGTVKLNGNINDASNTALAGLANRTQVLTLLTTVTDHLPVVADYVYPFASSTQPNQAPAFTKGADVVVTQSTAVQAVAGWAKNISAGSASEAGQLLNFVVTGNDNAALFATLPAVDAKTGTLTFATAPGVTGTATITLVLHDNGGTANGGVDTSAPQSFSITVNPPVVNLAPSFTKGADVMVNQNVGSQAVVGWATNISSGSSAEAGQALNFIVTNNTNPGLFTLAPSVDAATGTLTFMPATGATGSATITLVLHDNGGTANGGVDTSAPQTFTVTVNPVFVNQAPLFTKGVNQTVNQDSGAQTVAGWATNISAGPASEAGQALNFIVTGNNNASLFAVAPAVDAATGTLTFTPAAGVSGTALVTLVLHDDGGTANGGADTSAPQSFTITVAPPFVNQAPSFTKGGDVVVNQSSAVPSLAGWATNISPGAASEAGQTLTFVVTDNSNTALFATAPAVDAKTGTLTFTPAAGATGTATITLVLKDNGGTANGGVDTSAPQTFTITVNPVVATTGQRFDFNYGTSPTQFTVPAASTGTAYTGVKNTDLYSAAKGFGWSTTVSGFDRGTQSGTAYSSLLRDGAWGYGGTSNARTFRTDIANGTYEVTVTSGDAWYRNNTRVTVVTGSGAGLTNLAVSAGQFAEKMFTVTVTTGQLGLQFSGNSNNDTWTVNGLEIRPAAKTLVISGPTTTLTADGKTLDTFLVSGLTPGAVYTLSSSLGSIIATSTDADRAFIGNQIQPTSTTITFQVRRPTAAGVSTVMVEELSGASRGVFGVTYVSPTAPRTATTNSATSSSATTAGDAGAPSISDLSSLALAYQVFGEWGEVPESANVNRVTR